MGDSLAEIESRKELEHQHTMVMYFPPMRRMSIRRGGPPLQIPVGRYGSDGSSGHGSSQVGSARVHLLMQTLKIRAWHEQIGKAKLKEPATYGAAVQGHVGVDLQERRLGVAVGAAAGRAIPAH